MSQLEAVSVETGEVTPIGMGHQAPGVGPSEIQALVMMASMKPRIEQRCIKATLAILENNPDFASKGIYQIPRGGTTIYGTSVHGARAIATAWTNTMTGGLIIDPSDEKAIVRGIFVDGQNGRIAFRDRLVNRTVHRRRDGLYRLNDEEYGNQIKIEQSKAERDAILAGIPQYVVDKFFAHAFDIAAKKGAEGGATPLERWEAAQAILKKLRVSEVQALEFLAVEKPEQLTNALVTKLGLTLNSIRQGEATVSGVFGEVPEDSGAGDKPKADLPQATVSEESVASENPPKPAPDAVASPDPEPETPAEKAPEEPWNF